MKRALWYIRIETLGTFWLAKSWLNEKSHGKKTIVKSLCCFLEKIPPEKTTLCLGQKKTSCLMKWVQEIHELKASPYHTCCNWTSGSYHARIIENCRENVNFASYTQRGGFQQFPFRWIYYYDSNPPEMKLGKHTSVHCGILSRQGV